MITNKEEEFTCVGPELDHIWIGHVTCFTCLVSSRGEESTLNQPRLHFMRSLNYCKGERMPY